MNKCIKTWWIFVPWTIQVFTKFLLLTIHWTTFWFYCWCYNSVIDLLFIELNKLFVDTKKFAVFSAVGFCIAPSSIAVFIPQETELVKTWIASFTLIFFKFWGLMCRCVNFSTALVPVYVEVWHKRILLNRSTRQCQC